MRPRKPAEPEDDQHALGLRLHPGVEIDAVRPDVDVSPGREVAALPAVIFLLPLAGQPRDHVRREVRRVRAEQRGQRLLEVPGRNAAQVEYRQQGIEALRAPRPAGDAGTAADLLLRRHALGPVPHLRAAHLERADPGLDAALGPIPMPHDPLAAIRQRLLGMMRDSSA
jgi:hypothetical protein